MSRRKQSTSSSKSATVAFSWIKTFGWIKAKPPPPPDYASSRAMRLVEPKPLSAAAGGTQYASTAYLVEPPADATGDDGDYGVDGRAAAYIMRVRAKCWSEAATSDGAVAPQSLPTLVDYY